MTTIIALTGPPAAGKSTVCDLFEDVGVPTVSTGDGVRRRAQEEYLDPGEDEVWAMADWLRDEHGPAGPTIACSELIEELALDNELVVVSDLREQAEVEWLNDMYDSVLVIRVDTRHRSERTRRYVQREVGDIGDDPVPRDREQELRDELYDREQRESPYPRQYLTLLNDGPTRTDEIMYRIQGLCRALDPDGDYDAGVYAR